MVFLDCIYDDENPDTYEGIRLTMGAEGRAEVFNTNKPLLDYLTALVVARHRVGWPETSDIPIMGTSSIDHFSLDGGATLDFAEATEDLLERSVALAETYLVAEGEL